RHQASIAGQARRAMRRRLLRRRSLRPSVRQRTGAQSPRVVYAITMADGVYDQTDAFGIAQHLPDRLPAEPMALFKAWFDEAHARKVHPNPNCMTLATIDADGRPSARIVLCKAIDTGSGSLVFYTNRTSRKGTALESHPRAALVFHWDTLDRQVRIEGPVTHA